MQPQLRRALGVFAGALLVCCLLSASAFAAPVEGFMGFGGVGVLAFSTGGGAPGSNFIDFCPVNDGPEPAGGCGIAMPGDPLYGQGELTVDSRNGDFAAFNAVGSTGTIFDITDANPAPAPYTFIPAVGLTSIAGFVDFDDPWTYTVTGIVTPTCSGPTQFCTPYFKLDQSGNTTAVTLATVGTITNGAGEISTFDLLLTGNFNGNLGSVIAAASSATGAFSPSWSGTLFATAPPIPEPGPFSLALLGFAAVGIGALRSRRKA